MYARICQIVCRVCMLLWLCSCAVVSFSNGWYTFVERYFLWIHQYANRPPRAASSEMFSRKFANTASTIRWTFFLMPPTTSSAANFARVMELGPDNNKTQFIFFLSSSMSIHQTVAGNRNVEPLARAVNNQTYARRVHDQVSMWVWTCESGTTIRFRALKVFIEVLCNFRLKHVRPTHPSLEAVNHINDIRKGHTCATLKIAKMAILETAMRRFWQREKTCQTIGIHLSHS